MKPKYRRGLVILGALGTLACSLWMILQAFEENLVFYKNPSDLREIILPLSSSIRVGGIVEDLNRDVFSGGVLLRFWLKDFEGGERIPVVFSGWVPDLFKEGAGAVVSGNWTGNLLQGTEILAKHDAQYKARSSL